MASQPPRHNGHNPYRSVGVRQRLYGNEYRRKVSPRMLRGHDNKPSAVHPVFIVLLLLFGLALLMIPSISFATGGAFYWQTSTELEPRLEKLESYRPFQTSRFFDRNGELLYEYVEEGRRDPAKLDQISQLLIDATVAVEDKTFWTNPGVDYEGVLKAVFRNTTSGDIVSGGSSITQQYVKLVLLTDEERQQGYERKIKEAVLAQQLTDKYTKEEILEMYLNEINYGNRAYGAQAAAKYYFGIDAKDLNLNQASLLAGLPQLPTLYNPIQFLDENRVLVGVELKNGWLIPENPLPNGINRPRARQVDVLRQMVINGLVSEREAREAIAQDLHFVDQEQWSEIKAPHFVFHVLEEIRNDPELGRLLSNEGGLNIKTTLDLRIQALAQREAKRRIDELVAENRNIHNAAVVVQQPGTGQILAMVGSVDYNAVVPTQTPGEEGNVMDGNVNVTTRERQPGSALKPFTYLSALKQGVMTPGSIIWDVQTRFPIRREAFQATPPKINKCLPDRDAYYYCPQNYDMQWHGPMRMREGLANSLNMPAVLTLKQAGIAETLDLLHGLGINGLQRGPENYGLSVTLGGGEVTPLDLTTAYNTLANDGRYVKPTAILEVTDREGKVVREFKATPNEQVVDPALVAIVRDFMGDNKARTPIFGPNNILKLSRPAHVKTGTTNDFRDAWAVGYTPYVTVGVWTGNNNNERTANVESTEGGGVIWNRIMEGLFADRELDQFLRGPDLSKPTKFPEPSKYGAVQRQICQIGGPFGQRTTEWFTPEMLKKHRNATCDFVRTQEVVLGPDGGYCIPDPKGDYAGQPITTQVLNVPYSTYEIKVVGGYNWPTAGGRGVMPRTCGLNDSYGLISQPGPNQRAADQSTSVQPGFTQPGGQQPGFGQTTPAQPGLNQPMPFQPAPRGTTSP
jgi:membrane peptidoglycan carboxypeptidase